MIQPNPPTQSHTLASMRLSPRALEIYARDTEAVVVRTDRFFAALLFLQWLVAVVLALVVSPRTWSGTASVLHPHVWAAVFGGLAVVSIPIALCLLRPAHTARRARGSGFRGGLAPAGHAGAAQVVGSPT